MVPSPRKLSLDKLIFRVLSGGARNIAGVSPPSPQHTHFLLLLTWLDPVLRVSLIMAFPSGSCGGDLQRLQWGPPPSLGRASPNSTCRFTVTQDPASVPRVSLSPPSPATAHTDSPIRSSRGRLGTMTRATVSWDPPGSPHSGPEDSTCSRLLPALQLLECERGTLPLFSFQQSCFVSFSLFNTLPHPHSWLERPMTAKVSPEEGTDPSPCRPLTFDSQGLPL